MSRFLLSQRNATFSIKIFSLALYRDQSQLTEKKNKKGKHNTAHAINTLELKSSRHPIPRAFFHLLVIVYGMFFYSI